jgi:hypothetical protein
MTSRERVLRAPAHQPTDRVPRLLYGEAIGYTAPIERLIPECCAPAHMPGPETPWENIVAFFEATDMLPHPIAELT